MSEAVSALKAAEFTGGIAEVTLMDPIGMISVRGDLGVGYMKKALKKAGPGPSRYPQRPDQRGSRCRVDVTGRAVVALPL